MTTTQLDKSRPHLSVKDFVTNRVTIIQDGKSFNEQGFPILVAHGAGPKYLCPQCDFGCKTVEPLYEHAEKIHNASDTQTAALKVYVQNIDRGLPSDEGIEWATFKLTRTTAQKSFDERESETGRPAGVVKPLPALDALTCEHCPDLPPFKNKASLGSHRWNRHQIRGK